MKDLPLNLTPKTKELLLTVQDFASIPFGNPSIKEYRELAKGYKTMVGTIAEGINITSCTLPIAADNSSLKVDFFAPKDLAADMSLPTLIFFPGGGFITDLECHDSPCSIIAEQAQCRVILVHYRLAPEHKFPAGLNDAYNAINFFYTYGDQYGIDRNNFFVGGDSSGATFAAQCALKIRDDHKDISIKQVIMVNPTTDFSLSIKSHKEEEAVNCFQPGLLEYLFQKYLPEGIERDSPAVSPYWHTNHRNLPPHSILVGEFDGIRGQSEGYLKKLLAAGNDAKLHLFRGQIHQFFLGRGKLNDGEDPILAIADIINYVARGVPKPSR